MGTIIKDEATPSTPRMYPCGSGPAWDGCVFVVGGRLSSVDITFTHGGILYTVQT